MQRGFLDDERPSPLGLGKGRFFMAMLGLTLFCMDCSQDWHESGFFRQFVAIAHLMCQDRQYRGVFLC